MTWHLIICFSDLLKQFLVYFFIEWQITTDQSEQNNSTTPTIDTGPTIRSILNSSIEIDYQSSITSGAA